MTDKDILEKSKEIYIRCFDDDFKYPDVLNAIRIGVEEGSRELVQEMIANKTIVTENKVVDAVAYALYYSANPDSDMCIPNCAYIQAEKMFEKWKEEKR